MNNEKRQIQIEILDTKAGEHRFVFAVKGEIIPRLKHEIVIDYCQVGVIKEGDPVLVLDQTKVKVVESDNVVWDFKKK